jgi:tetratricopeptide (TPR) repeat protein
VLIASICFAGVAVAQPKTDVNPNPHEPATGTGKKVAMPAMTVAPIKATNTDSDKGMPSDAAKTMALKYLRYAQGRYANKQFQQCVTGAEKAISYNPTDAKAYELRGSALYRLEMFKEAIEDFNRCEQLSNGSLTVQGYEDRGSCYAQLHEHQKVVVDYTKAIRLNPKLAWLYSQRAAAFSDIKQIDKAIKDIDTAINIKPELYMYENRADYYARVGQYQKAIDDYTKAMQLAPEIPMHYMSRAKLLEKLGKLELARKDRAKADEIIYRDMAP